MWWLSRYQKLICWANFFGDMVFEGIYSFGKSVIDLHGVFMTHQIHTWDYYNFMKSLFPLNISATATQQTLSMYLGRISSPRLKILPLGLEMPCSKNGSLFTYLCLNYVFIGWVKVRTVYCYLELWEVEIRTMSAGIRLIWHLVRRIFGHHHFHFLLTSSIVGRERPSSVSVFYHPLGRLRAPYLFFSKNTMIIMNYDLFASALKAICLGDDIPEQNHKGKDYPSNSVMKEVALFRIILYLGQDCRRQGQRFSANSLPLTLTGICSLAKKPLILFHVGSESTIMYYVHSFHECTCLSLHCRGRWPFKFIHWKKDNSPSHTRYIQFKIVAVFTPYRYECTLDWECHVLWNRIFSPIYQLEFPYSSLDFVFVLGLHHYYRPPSREIMYLVVSDRPSVRPSVHLFVRALPAESFTEQF